MAAPRVRKPVASVAMAAVFALALTACGGGGNDGGSADGKHRGSNNSGKANGGNNNGNGSSPIQPGPNGGQSVSPDQPTPPVDGRPTRDPR